MRGCGGILRWGLFGMSLTREQIHRQVIATSGDNGIQSIPLKDWPLWAKALAMIAKPEDKGIGDVVARTIGAENSEAFKKWFKATTGKDCGCTGRQRRWNIEYPL